jgi:hypothetical protein
VQIGIGTIGTTDDIMLLHANIFYSRHMCNGKFYEKGIRSPKVSKWVIFLRVTDLTCAHLYFDVGNGGNCFDGTHNKVKGIAVSLFTA